MHYSSDHPHRNARPCSFARSIVWLALLIVMASVDRAPAETPKNTTDLLSTAGMNGGVVVQLGVSNGTEIRSLRRKDSFLVQGLDTDYTKIARVREKLAAQGVQGNVSVQEFDGRRLPYIDNMVNLIVVSDRFNVADEELTRVLVPSGKAIFVDFASKAVVRSLTKPQPEDVDDWTHYLYGAGNNAVSKDTRIDSIRCQQWVAGPRWSRHHDHIAGLTALVSAGGRIYYVMDEGKAWSVLLPAKHFLVARDAYNGMVLWKKPLASWHPHLWPLKSGPAQLPRRLVVQGRKLYLPLGMAEPLSVLDAETGDLLATFAETKGTEEVLVADGKVFVLANPDPELYEKFDLGNAHNGSQQGRVAKEYPWKRTSKRVVVLDEGTGKLIWEKPVIAAPLSLTVGKSSLFFFNGTQIVAMDKYTGDLQWRSPKVEAKQVFAVAEAPILVAYKDYVLFSGANGRMSCYAANTGERLWEAEHLKGGYCSPQDLFVIDDLVWSGAVDSPKNTGVFVGRDLQTGEPKREIPPQDVPYTFGHHRCHRAKATSRFILASKTGIEFYDIANRQEEVNHWVRGGCLYGIMPANGLVYSPMHSCACHLDSKLVGFNALAPAANAEGGKPTSEGRPQKPAERLQKGPAYDRAANLKSESPSLKSAGWHTYRSDNARSGFSPAPVADGLKRKWQTSFKGKLSAVTVGYGNVFVAAVDQHCVMALDQNSGKLAWTFHAGGRIDSPPTLFQGHAYFGCADGHVYCVTASAGQLAWRFRVAPDSRQLCAYGQLESVWPVHGSVLIKDGKMFCVGGRSSFLNGGLPFVRVDARSGELEAESMLDDWDSASGKSMQLLSSQSIMPSANPDILSCDENGIFMRVERLSDDGRRLGSIQYDEATQYDERHVFSWAGFLEDSWMHRLYMSYGNGKLPLGTYLNWWEYGQKNPDGRLLVTDHNRVFSYGLKPEYHAWSSTFLDYHLFSVNKQVETEPVTGPTVFGKINSRTPTQKLRYNWTAELPFYVRAMVKADNKLIVCGPEKIIDEQDAVRRYPDKSLSAKLEKQDAILDGQNGSQMWVVDAGSGKIVARHQLSWLPIWDGMAAADGHVFLATQDGVICLSGG
jgi:outer membrane protein assembly factor BamB